MDSHVWMPSTRRTRRLCWSTKKCTCRVYCRRSRHDGAATRSRKGVDVYSTLTSCSPPVTSMITTTTTTKSWRSDTLIILPGWECHTGGSRSKPTAHRCSQSGRRLWVAHQVHNHEPNGSAAVRQCQHDCVFSCKRLFFFSQWVVFFLLQWSSACFSKGRVVFARVVFFFKCVVFFIE